MTVPPMPPSMRFAYERGRVAIGLRLVLPALLYFVFSQLWGVPSWAPLAVLALGGFLSGWAGRAYQVGASTGLLVGLIPFSAALLAPLFGPHCHVDACSDACMAACALGGLFAGALGGRQLLRRRGDHRSWAVASAMVVSAGALGCSCLGLGSLAALLTTWLLSTAPHLVRMRRA